MWGLAKKWAGPLGRPLPGLQPPSMGWALPDLHALTPAATPPCHQDILRRLKLLPDQTPGSSLPVKSPGPSACPSASPPLLSNPCHHPLLSKPEASPGSSPFLSPNTHPSQTPLGPHLGCPSPPTPTPTLSQHSLHPGPCTRLYLREGSSLAV